MTSASDGVTPGRDRADIGGEPCHIAASALAGHGETVSELFGEFGDRSYGQFIIRRVLLVRLVSCLGDWIGGREINEFLITPITSVAIGRDDLLVKSRTCMVQDSPYC